MSDIILTSPILRDPSEAAPPGAAPNETFEFGFDPSSDPELAMVSQFCHPIHAIDAKSIGRPFVCQRRKSKHDNWLLRLPLPLPLVQGKNPHLPQLLLQQFQLAIVEQL